MVGEIAINCFFCLFTSSYFLWKLFDLKLIIIFKFELVSVAYHLFGKWKHLLTFLKYHYIIDLHLGYMECYFGYEDCGIFGFKFCGGKEFFDLLVHFLGMSLVSLISTCSYHVWNIIFGFHALFFGRWGNWERKSGVKLSSLSLFIVWKLAFSLFLF